MHGSYRENRDLEDVEFPADLKQTPAQLVVLSYSDSDLGMFADAWKQASKRGDVPSLRVANLSELRHPFSIDIYLEQTLAHARGILIRLIGGMPYWTYGLQQLKLLARQKGIALAVLPADGRPDEALSDTSTMGKSDLEALNQCCAQGGLTAASHALAQLADAAGVAPGELLTQADGPSSVPGFGFWTPTDGVRPAAAAGQFRCSHRVIIVFYRSFLVSNDLAPIKALFAALENEGLTPLGAFVPSLKAPDAAHWLEETLPILNPAAIVSATAFSAKGESGRSPLEVVPAPVFQVALSTSSRRAWDESLRGLSPVDLAMHVVLPEVDGRIFAGVTSFKESGEIDPDLQFERTLHSAEGDRIAAAASRVAAWVRLQRTPRDLRRVAIVLSSYPKQNWNFAHAVGLDAIASTEAILEDLRQAGYATEARTDLATALGHETLSWPLSEYKKALARLPQSLQQQLSDRWGQPDDDTAVSQGAFHFRGLLIRNALVLLQPERALADTREASYHDLDACPRHAYVAFYLWLTRQEDVHALVHVGAHGTLEWLPGKSVALSAECWPDALCSRLPIVYPFIVNDPGEAAQAKRRVGAVVLGHVPPPVGGAGAPPHLRALEALLDEFSNAVGLDPERRRRLLRTITAEARALGLAEALSIDGASPAEAINQIDRFVCDLKDGQFCEGLHVYGRARAESSDAFSIEEAAAGEREGLLQALDGLAVKPGPAGSPYRGRPDVVPTGRNLFMSDPRAIPTPAAYAQGELMARELLRQHLQDEGEWLRSVLVDLWASATMRTAGEEFAMALYLIGAQPCWDDKSHRVCSVEIIPLEKLGRPRVDVTLRISGLFRDIFPELVELYREAVQRAAMQDEPNEQNPLKEPGAGGVYGPAPGRYGVGIESSSGAEDVQSAAGEAWLAASSWRYEGLAGDQDDEGIRARVDSAQAFAHAQDMVETDLLLAADYANHSGGFAAARHQVSAGPVPLYHLDTTTPGAPRARPLNEELARVVYLRATNPRWLDSMKEHGFRGAAEIAATLEHLGAFAELTNNVPSELFDSYYDATLGDAELREFLEEANPAALAAMGERFRGLMDQGLFRSRRNALSQAWDKGAQE